MLTYCIVVLLFFQKSLKKGVRAMPKGKAIFVDGPSLAYMGRRIGIPQIDFPGLFELLTQEIAPDEGEVVEKPFYTVATQSAGQWTKSLSTAGFDVKLTATKNGNDDREIIKRINNVRNVSAIIMVSTDQDFVPALRAKAQQGIKIFWVGTRVIDQRSNTPVIGAGLEQVLTNEFTFVELADYRDRITYKAMAPQYDPAAPRRLSISLEITLPHGEAIKCLRDVTRLVGKYPGMRINVKG